VIPIIRADTWFVVDEINRGTVVELPVCHQTVSIESVKAVPFLTVRILLQFKSIVGSVTAPADAAIQINKSPSTVPVGSPGVVEVVLAVLAPIALTSAAMLNLICP
jgi:hypothetical protein